MDLANARACARDLLVLATGACGVAVSDGWPLRLCHFTWQHLPAGGNYRKSIANRWGMGRGVQKRSLWWGWGQASMSSSFVSNKLKKKTPLMIRRNQHNYP